MRQPFRFLQWCQSGPGGTALLLVLTTGALVGYYGWLALVAPPPPTFYLDFGAATWLQASEPSNNVCFRKNLYLSETPKYAWLQMAGIDGFRLSVNGKQASIGQNESESESTILSLTSGGNQSIICDITHYLLPGTNTIAVNVTRGSFPGRCKLVCRGGVIDQSGRLSEFSSDKSWRVALTPGTIPSLISWTDREMDDARWAHAEVAPSERTGLTQPVTLPPVLLQQPVKGKWIVDQRPGPAGNTTFQRHFDAPHGNTDAWLQIAANGNYSVIFNGHFLGDFTDSSPMIHFLHLKRWMKAWGNDLSVQVRGLDALPALIAQVSFLSGGAETGSIVSDHDWMLPSSRLATTIGSYNYAGEHWGLPPKMASPAGLPSVEATRQTIAGIALMLIVAAAVFLGWIRSGSLLAKRHKWEVARALGIDATLHLPVLVATATLLLLRYDIRFRPDSPVKVEFFLGLVAVLILPRLLAWARRKEPAPSLFSAWERWRGWASQNGFWLALGVIVLSSLAMRLHNLTAFSLDQDDILIRNYATGIFDRGYPSLNFYNHVIRITTYELVPYPIALSCFIFGWSDWAVLLPAVVFGTLTTLLLGVIGRNLFDWRTGLLAALIHAFDPLNVFWAQHCFHPSQDQFFAILTIWFFYLAIRQAGKLDSKYFYAACLCFCLTYLSWEGAGYLLPVLAVTLLLMHPGRWSWLREPHLWMGLIVVGSIVLIQLSLRSTVVPLYLFLGYGMTSLTPSLYFLNPESWSLYYVSSVLLTEPHVLLTILCAAGALFVWQHLTVRYCFLAFLGLLLCFSLLLPVYSIRYFYFYQTLLILTACAVFFIVWDRIRELTSGWRTTRLLAWGSGIAALLLVLGTATETGLKVFRLSLQTLQGRTRIDPNERYDVVRQDTRGPAEFVASRLRPGDIVLANLTQAFYLYGRRMPDYALNTLLAARMIFLDEYAAYRHKFVGIPMVLNLRDMQSVFGQARRIWYIGGGSVIEGPDDLKNAIDFVTERAKIVYSTAHAHVYLWDGTATLAQQTVANPALPPQPDIPPEKPPPEDRVVEELNWAENGKPLSYPRVTRSNLYPEWIHQKVSERDPAHINAALKVQPIQPPREPEKPESDEKASQ
jgi:dolichyl-phosphate-mannose-protein mannosyltransferase